MNVLGGLLVGFALIFITSPSNAETAFYHLSDSEEAEILAAVSDEMLDPESTRITDLVAATDSKIEGLAYVCGKVSGRNTFGGYAQPTPFFGTLADTKSGDKAFFVISIADATAASQSVALRMCLKHMPKR